MHALPPTPFEPQSIRWVAPTPNQPDGRWEVLRLWPRPVAVATTDGKVWHELQPRVALPEIEFAAGLQRPDPCCPSSGWDPPLASLLEAVPVDVLVALQQVPLGPWWRCFQALHAVPETALRQLFESDLVLAVALVTNYRRGPSWLAWEELRGQLGQRRRELLPVVGLPEEEWVLRVLRRTEPQILDWPGLDLLGHVVSLRRLDVTRVLTHCPYISADTLRVLADPRVRAIATPALLHELPPRYGLYQDLRQVLMLRTHGYLPERPAQFSSWEQLQEVLRPFEPGGRDGWQVGFVPDDFPDEFMTPSGACSLFRSEPRVTLEPVTTAEGYIDHGVEMGTCLATASHYPVAASTGDAALYAARWDGVDPDGAPTSGMASVWLSKGCYGWWSVAEVGLPGNRGTAPPWLLQLLDDWVCAVGGGPGTLDEALAAIARAVELDVGWRCTGVIPFGCIFEHGRRCAVLRLWWGDEALNDVTTLRLIRQHRRHHGRPVQLVIIATPGPISTEAIELVSERAVPAVALVSPHPDPTTIVALSRRVHDEDSLLAEAVGLAMPQALREERS